MLVEIITVGDELLIGQTIDTNSAWMGKELNRSGFIVHRITSISDNAQEIKNALKEASQRVKIVLITGGLGPTKDDITKHTLCEYFDTSLQLNQEVLARIEQFFKAYNRPMLDVNVKQAELPVNCTVLPNLKGTASGMWFEKDGVVFVSMPGVPYEMTHLMETQVIPRISAKFEVATILHKTIMTQGLGESFMAEIIKDWENDLADKQLKLAYLPSPGILKLRISSYGGDKNMQQAKIEQAVKALYQLIPQYIFGEDDEQLEATIAKLLDKNKQTIAVAESCTGGYLAHLFTSIPGSSAYFKGGIVAYNNQIKTQLLNVEPTILSEHGAESQPTVCAMAENVRKLFDADYAIATSGIAGPDGGTEKNPVGTIYFAVASRTETFSDKQKFGGDRLRNIERSTKASLNLLRKSLLKDFAN